LRKDGMESYDNIFGDVKLLSHSYPRYTPILSMCTTRNHKDIPIPTWEDWEMKEYNVNICFKKKIPTAVFRGSSTGIGYNSDTNSRIKISKMEEKIEDGYPLLNAGITKINNRIRKLKGDSVPHTIEEDIKLSEYISFEKQTEYKYIINLDGYVSAFRLTRELGSMSVILLNESDYNLWFYKYIKPYVHYVPIKRNLEDLYEKIRWCRANEKECLRIVKNAYRLYQSKLSKDGMFKYLEKVCNSISRTIKWNRSSCEINNLSPDNLSPDNLSPDNLSPDNISPEFVLIRKNDKSCIYTNENTILKISQNVSHEIQIYKKYIKKLDKKNFPTFMGEFRNYGILVEKIEGITFYDFILYQFDMKIYLTIFIQVCEIYQEMYSKFGLIHGDAYPWNIIVQNNFIPCIIDFDNAKVKGDKYQDVLSLIFNTIYLIIYHHYLDKKDLYLVYRIIEYFRDTTYFKGLDKVKDIRERFELYKKFDFISNTCFVEFERYDISDFILYLKKLIF
jgi:tRNA A-37 threonylcarbamoyl transferase component Bud32